MYEQAGSELDGTSDTAQRRKMSGAANAIKQYRFADVIYKSYHQTLTYDSRPRVGVG